MIFTSSHVCLVLLHSLWQMALLAGVVGLVARLRRRQSVESRYAMHVAALLLGVALLPMTYAYVQFLHPATAVPIATVPFAGTPPYRPPYSALSNSVPLKEPTAPGGSSPATPLSAAFPTVAPQVLSKPVDWSRFAPWLVGIYVVGVVVMLVRLFSGIVQSQRLGSGAKPITDGPLRETLQKLSEQWSLRAVPALAYAERVVVPKVVGLIQPTILLPASALTGLTASELEMILAHELAHVRRHDMGVYLFQRLAEAVLFFNPALWYLSRRISTLREYCCDEMTCRAMAESSMIGSTSDDPKLRYATALLRVVELAGPKGASGNDLAALAASGRSPSELRRRVARLFGEPLREPVRLSRGGILILAAMGLILTGGPMLWPTQAQSPENVSLPLSLDNKENAPIKWPDLFEGTVRDDEDQPITNAKVRLVLKKIHQFSIGRWDEAVAEVEGSSDASGKFSLDLSKFPELRHRPLSMMLTVTAPGYADEMTWNWYVNRKEYVTWFPKIKMLESRAIRGRCVDPDGNPVGGAVVRVMADHGKRWLWSSLEANSDGTFEIAGPMGKEVQYWICTDQWSPQWGSVKPSQNELGDISLEAGTAVEGTVLDRDGSPLVDCVIVTESCFGGEIPSTLFSVKFATKTDSQGHYRLPPVSGAYKVYLSQAVATDNQVDEVFVVSKKAPPSIAPLRLQLEGKQLTRELDFQAGPMLRLGGTIRWEDGRKVEGCEVRVSYMPDEPGFGSGITLARSYTNAQGEYSLEVAQPIESISLWCAGDRNEEGVWHLAYPVKSGEVDMYSAQTRQLIRNGQKVTQDRNDLDWVLRTKTDTVKTNVSSTDKKTKDATPATISGKIVLEDGSPATTTGWLHYESSYDTGPNSSHGISGTVDQFTDAFSCKVHSGTVWLLYFPDGYAPAWVGPLELKSGQQLDDVTITLKPGFSELIRVTNEDGQPVVGATIVAHPEINRKCEGPVHEKTTDAKGEFLLEHLADTRYQFSIRAPGYQPLRTAPLRLEEGEVLRPTMIRSQPCTGVVRLADGTPAPGVKLYCQHEIRENGKNLGGGVGYGKLLATSDATNLESTGQFSLGQLTAGSHYLFIVEAADGARGIVANLRSDQKEIEIVLPRRCDLVVNISGDLSNLFQRRGKPYVSVRQRIDFNPAPGKRYGSLIGEDIPIELNDAGGTAILRGLAVDLSENAGPQQVEVSLNYPNGPRKIVNLNLTSATTVEFVLPNAKASDP